MLLLPGPGTCSCCHVICPPGTHQSLFLSRAAGADLGIATRERVDRAKPKLGSLNLTPASRKQEWVSDRKWCALIVTVNEYSKTEEMRMAVE